MRFKLDENMPLAAAQALRAVAHDVLTVPEQQLSGQADAIVAAVCRAERRVLMTLDLDFADIRGYPPADHAGIIVLRAHVNAAPHVVALVSKVIQFLESETLDGRLWIVTPDRIRIHD